MAARGAGARPCSAAPLHTVRERQNTPHPTHGDHWGAAPRSPSAFAAALWHCRSSWCATGKRLVRGRVCTVQATTWCFLRDTNSATAIATLPNQAIT